MDSLKGMRVAVYARSSGDNQHGSSIDDQVSHCCEHVRRLGGQVPEVRLFTDRAGTTKARPGFDALLKLVRARGIDAIVVESADRLTRNLGDALLIRRVRVLCLIERSVESWTRSKG